MQSAMKSMRRQHMDEKKASKQLREATKHLKEELHLLDVSVQKASMDAGKKRYPNPCVRIRRVRPSGLPSHHPTHYAITSEGSTPRR
jgi:hypothetical protein